MNILYFYIRNYKALDDQDVVFSSSYIIERCGKLIKIDKNSTLENFYSEGLDIVSLFGKNGVGKSTVVEALTLALRADKEVYFEYFLAFELNDDIYYINKTNIAFIIESINSKSIELFDSDIVEFERNLIHFSHVIDPLSQNKKIRRKGKFNYVDCSNQLNISKLGSYKFKIEQARSCFDLLKDFNLAHHNVSKVPMTARIDLNREIKIKLESIFRIINIKSERESYIHLSDEKVKDLSEKIHVLLSSIGNENEIVEFDRHINSRSSDNSLTNVMKATYLSFNSSIIINKLADYLINRSSKPSNTLMLLHAFFTYLDERSTEVTLDESIVDFLIIMFNSLVEYFSIRDIVHIFKNISADFFDSQLKESNIFSKFRDFVDSYEASQFSVLIDKHTDENLSDTVINVETFEEFFGFNEIIRDHKNFLNTISFSWSGISAGQSSALTLFSRIKANISTGKSYTIFIDEGEAHLHPEWQRRFVSDIIRFFEKFNFNNKFKIVLLSHSPFVLGDLARQSINFIGNQVPHDGGKYFGSNIFEIFKNGFLLDVTLGQFAFEKISKLVESQTESELISNEVYSQLGDDFIIKLIRKSIE